MKALDHQTFHALEIDALYEELDGPSSAAIRDHASSCESCASRFERLRRARQRGLSVLVEAVPDNFESRVMAAVDAALAKRAAGPVLVPRMELHSGAPAPPQAPPAAGAKIIPFFSRPAFQVAATLFLVLGAAALVTQLGMSKRASPMASSADQSPAAVAAAPAPADLAQTPAEEPVASAMATTTTASPTAAPIVALGGAEEAKPKLKAPQDPDQEGALALRAPSPSPPAAIAAQKPSKAAARPASGGSPTGGQGGDPAFAAAQALFNAGRYAEALPKFEALKGSNPEADLYAARCLQQTRGCAAAAPRYDAAAQRNSGTSVGSRAQLEGGACYAQLNKPAEARSRYQAAKRQGTYAAEADADLEALDRKSGAPAKAPPPNATSGPGNPANKAPASELDNAR